MVGIEEGTPEPAPYCHGCGREAAVCAAAPCGRGAALDVPRFCSSCGWRLREIAVVPGVGSLWCRTHGLVDGGG
jgi:hypothetical protein